MSRFKSFRGFILALSIPVLLAACSSNELEVTAQFANTQDIDEDMLVYFEEQPIGQVVDSKTQGNGSSIVIELDPSAAQLVATNSAVVVNRLKQKATLEIYNPNGITSEFVRDGQQIEGLDSMFQLGAWMVGDAIQLGSNSLNEYVGAFQRYLQSDKFQQDKNVVQQQVTTATEQAQQAFQELGNELAATMQELATKEDEVAQAIEQLGDELSPMVQELGRSGSLLIDQLETFTQSLEQTDASEQQTGQAFLESLTATLEKLNESFEKGLDESVQADDLKAPTENGQ